MAAPAITEPGRVPASKWLAADHGLQMVMTALGGDKDQARIVGGAVRDALLDRGKESDFDIATVHDPDSVIELLTAANLKHVPTGYDHGTITAIVDGTPYEITSLRADVATDGRRATVSYTDDWAEDAARRDFTINGLYADLAGRVYDYATGLDDLDGPNLRFIGDADQRIREDYLRILRLFRFAAQFEGAQIDRTALMAASGNAAGMGQLSAERLRAEILKLLAGNNVRSVLRTMAAVQILPRLFGDVAGLDLFNALIRIEKDLLFVADPVRRLYALLGPKLIDAAIDKFRLSNKEAARLRAIKKLDSILALFDPVLSVRDVHRLLHRHGGTLFRDLVILRWACDRNPGHDANWRALLAHADVWQPKTLPVGGDDVMGLGVPNGPAIGKALAQLEDVWVEAGFPDRDDTLALLRQQLAAD